MIQFLYFHERDEVSCYKHLGVKTDPILSTKEVVDDACNKLRGTFLSIINSGISPEWFNPISSKVIYRSIVIPKAMYGCELWTSLTSTDILRLERSHRFSVKQMKSLPIGTSTELALCTLNINKIETIIDYKKLQVSKPTV